MKLIQCVFLLFPGRCRVMVALVCLNIRSNAYGLPVVNMACLKAEGNCRMLKYAAG